jgi:hypothetical protein
LKKVSPPVIIIFENFKEVITVGFQSITIPATSY